MRDEPNRREFLKQSALAGTAVAFPALAGCRLLAKRAAGTGDVAAIDPGAIRKFGAGLQGQIIRPGDPGYESARRVFNWAIDRHPGMVVRCAGKADVVRAVEFARKHDLLVAVRGGGHSLAGQSTCDGGMVIDVSRMKRIDVDPQRRLARVESGLTLGEFDRATQARGLATTLGTAPLTGIAGLTLGGGFGWLAGKHGLACDNVSAVELVNAEGKTLIASGEQNQDLHWGVRGGGGNFGVVTSFDYRLHPVGHVLAGAVTYPASRLRDMLRFYREFTSAAPDELSVQIGTVPIPGQPGPWIALCWCGDLKAGEKALKPLRSLGRPVKSSIQPKPYVEMQALFGETDVEKAGSAVRSNFLRGLSDEAIEVIVANVANAPSPMSLFFVEQLAGAASRVGLTETAFPQRERSYNFAAWALWLDPAAARPATSWVRGFWESMQPHARTEVYSNYLGDEGEKRARAAYGANYDRLVAVKKTYDPTNFFRLNQNVRPA